MNRLRRNIVPIFGVVFWVGGTVLIIMLVGFGGAAWPKPVLDSLFLSTGLPVADSWRLFQLWSMVVALVLLIALPPSHRLSLRRWWSVQPAVRYATIWFSGSFLICTNALITPRYPPITSLSVVPGAAARSLVIWTLLVLAAAMVLYSGRDAQNVQSGRPAKKLSGRRGRLLLLGWLVGFLLLIPGAPRIIDAIAPAVAPSMVQFTGLLPLLAIWSTVILLLYFAVGDGSNLYKDRLKPYSQIWSVFTVVALIIILIGQVNYQSVSTRLTAARGASRLVQTTIEALRISTGATLAESQDLAKRIVDYRTLVHSDLGASDPKADAAERKATIGAIQDRIPALQEQAADGQRRASAAKTQIAALQHTIDEQPQASVANTPIVALPTQSSQQTTIINQLAGVLGATVSTTNQLAPVLADAVRMTNRLQPEANENLNLLAATVDHLVGLAEDADNAANVAYESIGTINAQGMEMFLWLRVFYSILVLFPWMLLLLFLLRKRTTRAYQILVDLDKLDPSRGLLMRVLSGEQNSDLKEKQTEAVRKARNESQFLSGQALVDGSSKEHTERLVEGLARQAFSSLEYLLSLLLLTLLTTIGWYYVFYPEHTLGVVTLIVNEGGIKDLVSKIVKNLTPITLGFVGAYFYILQMLVRRYLADDLYPSAFLQAAQRIILAFILSLTLNVAAPSVEQAVGGKAATGASFTEWGVLLASFFAGIFPVWAVSWIRGLFNKFFTSSVPDVGDKGPLTQLDGVSIWTEARLFEENIENIQSMATAPIEQLVLGTHFCTNQIINWIDQAILYTHAGNKGEWFPIFRLIGITTASKLLSEVGLKQGQEGYESTPERVSAVVAAARALPIKMVTNASGPPDSPVADPSSLTEKIVTTISGSIMPDRNLVYILNFLDQSRP